GALKARTARDTVSGPSVRPNQWRADATGALERSTMRATIVAAILAAIAGEVSGETLPLADGRWRLEGAGTAVERFDGRDTLRIETGAATRSETSLQDGTIEFDVMLSRRRSFVSLHLRV